MFKFTRLSDDHLHRLRQLGFVHVTGLTAFDYKVGAPRKIEIKIHNDNHRAKTWNNNEVTVLITFDGQIWIGHINDEHYNDVLGLAEELEIRLAEAFVPCSNGESIPTADLLRRIADPYEDTSTTVDRLFKTAE